MLLRSGGPPYRLSYNFDIPPNSIRRDALDQHVAIGGEYFTVVSRGYTIRPLSAEQRSILRLIESRAESHAKDRA